MKFGLGRHDIVVSDMRKSRAAILEFKRATSAKKLQVSVQDALGQIAKRSYGKDLPDEEYTSILGVGIAFFGKSVKVGFEKVR